MKNVIVLISFAIFASYISEAQTIQIPEIPDPLAKHHLTKKDKTTTYILDSVGVSYWNSIIYEMQEIEKYKFNYDDNNNQLLEDYYLFDIIENQWYKKSYTTYAHDENHRLTELVKKIWVDDENIYRNAEKEVYQYDTEGNLVDFSMYQWNETEEVLKK